MATKARTTVTTPPPPPATKTRANGASDKQAPGYVPSFLLVELVTHALRELAELALRLGIVGVDHEVLEVPEAPAEVLEALALLEEAGDLCADLCVCVQVEGVGVCARGEEEGRVAVSKDRKSTRLNSSHSGESRMPSSA